MSQKQRGERPTRAALYTRVSTKEQVEGTSLATQLDRLRTHAEQAGWTVVAEYVDEGVNGDLPVTERPQASLMADQCQRGAIDVVAVVDLDRFGRDMVETFIAQRDLERAGVGFVSVGEGLDTRRESDRLNLQIRAVIAEQEKRKILERTTRGLRARALAGDWPGGPPPFGFRLVRPEGRARLAVDDAEAAVLRRAAALIVDEGHTTWTAAQTLNALGLLPRNSKVGWEHPNLRRSLLSPTLGGTWTYRPTRQKWEDSDPEPIEFEIPAILDPERHDALLDALGATSTSTGVRGRVYPLTGRVTGPCGGSFHGIWRRDRDSRFYRCSNSRPEAKINGRGCECRTVVADQVESLVWAEVSAVLSEPARLIAMAEDYLDLQAAHAGEAAPETLDAIDRKIAHLDDARTKQVVNALKAGVDAETLKLAVTELDAEKRTLEAHRARLVALQQQADAEGERAVRLRDLASSARARLGEMTHTERRGVLDLLDIRVRVTGWSKCPTCGGKGKLKGGKGGLACPTCHATRQVPTYSASGVVPEDVDAGDLDGEVPRAHAPPRRRSGPGASAGRCARARGW